MQFNDFFTLPTMLVTIGGIGAAIAYLLGTWKKGRGEAMKAADESNEILRGLIEDLKSEIKKMRERIHDQDNIITSLQLKVERMSALEGLVKAALIAHFKTDPAIAKSVKNMLEKGDNGK